MSIDKYSVYEFAWRLDPEFEDLSDDELVNQFRCEFQLNSEQLEHKYHQAHLEQHPLFPRAVWMREVEMENVKGDYWSWVCGQIWDLFWDIIPRVSAGDEKLLKYQFGLPGV